jgi:hypothetical protein
MPLTKKSTERKPEGVWPINRVDNHIIFEVGRNNVLVDTGSPISLGKHKTFSLMGKTIRLQPEIREINVDMLSDFIGCRIDVLLGGDFLGLMPFTIDFPGYVIRFYDRPVRFQGTTLKADLIAGVPLVEVSIAGRSATLFLDTGAKITYLSAPLVRGYRSVGKISDFYPPLGLFQTTRHEVPVSIAGKDIMLLAGKTPKGLNDYIEAFNQITGRSVQGILGNDLYYHFRVHFDLGRSRIILMPHEP